MAPTEQKSLVLLTPGGDFAVETRPVPKPGKGEVLAKVESAALNPVEWKIRAYKLPLTDYPAVLGYDAAGVVEQLGEGVTNLKPGDKILWQGKLDAEHAIFQQYSLLTTDLAAKMPKNISMDEAATVPLALATAFIGLYGAEKDSGQGGGATLEWFWAPDATGKNKNKPIVIIGGATSVGQFVIQLAKLSGFFPIITTVSEHNTELVTSLGATHVLSRSLSASEFRSAVAKITSDPIMVVYDSVSTPQTLIPAWDILAPGGKFIVLLAVPDAIKPGDNGRKVVHVYGTVNDPGQTAVGLELYKRLEGWLRDGTLKPNRVQVLPNGLAGIEAGLKLLQDEKVSGTKLVAHPHD